MITPLIVLTILLVPTLIAALIARVTSAAGGIRQGALLGYSAAFAFFSVGHFIITDEMVAMLPDFVPARTGLVYATGVLEAALALALLPKTTRVYAGLGCIAVLILFFPGNIYAAMNGVGPGGHQWGPVYLLVRVPLQAVLIFWGYWFVLRGEFAQLAMPQFGHRASLVSKG
ncbi:hypothetical protein [Pacificoceanicola onchidii]|uniref:DoxX family protein n=1 Tax=Pacificoceanicola onchidii TaxID=2562685 RepID=UPI0010A5D54F|nr:hypothetical protein [Pacificoceanicola onchidii]